MSETTTATKRNGPLRYFRWWLHTLLLSETGWLRWKVVRRETYSYGYEPPEPYAVAPPLRRMYETLKDARYGYRQKPRAWTYLYDKDRTGDLMMHAPWRNFGPFWRLFDR